jgi:hypothetical protein
LQWTFGYFVFGSVFERGADAMRQDLGSQMSKVCAGLLLGVALIAMAAVGTAALVVVTDAGAFAYRVLKGRPIVRGAISQNWNRRAIITAWRDNVAPVA